MRVTWVQPEDLLAHELVQARAAVRDVTAIADRWRAAGGSTAAPHVGASQPPASPELRELARSLLIELTANPEPSSSPLTRAIDVSRVPATSWTVERAEAAWLGRAVGCLLGKPVEKIPREGIREILEDSGRYPLNDYFSGVAQSTTVALRWPWNRASKGTSLAENIDGMPEDDDLNYTMLALHVLEEYGPEFTTDDVATTWLRELPAGRVFTAERIAYRNLLDGYDPPETATRGNPYREWIGAQIRADLYGWANPGDPEAAAEMAYRDARLSHTGNGIYGAMYVAAMTATACVSNELEDVLDTGAAAIPDDSKLSRAVEHARSLAELEPEDAFDRLAAAHEGLHWVHVLNNAALLTYGLAHGRGDFSRSICTVVSGGWDTDSNGATAGGIVGALNGGVPKRWTDPLHNRICTSLRDFDGIGFDKLAERTIALRMAT